MQSQNQVLTPERQKQLKVCKIILIIILLGTTAFSIAMLVEGNYAMFFVVAFPLNLMFLLALICFNCQNNMQANDDKYNLQPNVVNKNYSDPFSTQQTELNYQNRDVNDQYYQNFNSQPQYYQQNPQCQQTQFIPQKKQNIFQKLAIYYSGTQQSGIQ